MTNNYQQLQKIIEQAFDQDSSVNLAENSDFKNSVNQVLELLNQGKIRVCDKINHQWQVNHWVKKAILLSFRLNQNFLSKQQAQFGNSISFYDKVPLKFTNYTEQDFKQAGFRALPGSIVRHGSYIAKNVVLMPSFINLGAYVDEGTMIDTWSTIGSCAQIGKKCHISGGVGIAGVLEPLQNNPVIIEDNCFIGARSEIAEGVIIEEGSVISMGVFIGASTKIIDRNTGEIFYGKVPSYSVVVPGSMKSSTIDGLSLNCAVIVKRVDEKTRSKTSINELLRD